MCVYENFKAKDYEYYCFTGAQADVIRTSGITVKVFEISEQYKTNLINYVQYCDDNSIVLETVPECKDFALGFINNCIGDLFSDRCC